MIWQATKIALFLLVVVGIAFAADVFIGTGEIVRLSFHGREISMTTPVLALGVVAALVGVWLLLYLAGLAIAVIAFFSGDETAISRYLDRNRERRGFEPLRAEWSPWLSVRHAKHRYRQVAQSGISNGRN